MERQYIFYRTGKGCLIALIGGIVLLGGVIFLGIWLKLPKLVVIGFIILAAMLTAHFSIKHDKENSI